MAFGGVPCQNVGAPAGQTTWAQMHSDAGIDLSQSILFLLMSQQQHPESAGGWAGGTRAEAPNTSAERTANESVFMMSFFFFFLGCEFPCLGFFCFAGFVCASGGPSAFILTVSTCKGGQMSQNQRQSGATNTRVCLGRKCGVLVCAGVETRRKQGQICTRKPSKKQKMKRSS